MPPAQRYDADAKSAERQKTVVTVGNTKFYPRKRSIKMMEEWDAAAPEAAMDREEFEAASKEDRLLIFKSMAKQLGVLMADENGEAPTFDFLAEELDVEDGFNILEMLTPNIQAEEERAGNSETAASETDT